MVLPGGRLVGRMQKCQQCERGRGPPVSRPEASRPPQRPPLLRAAHLVRMGAWSRGVLTLVLACGRLPGPLFAHAKVLRVRIPDDAAPGTALSATSPEGVKVKFSVPPGLVAGSLLDVQYAYDPPAVALTSGSDAGGGGGGGSGSTAAEPDAGVAGLGGGESAQVVVDADRVAVPTVSPTFEPTGYPTPEPTPVFYSMYHRLEVMDEHLAQWNAARVNRGRVDVAKTSNGTSANEAAAPKATDPNPGVTISQPESPSWWDVDCANLHDLLDLQQTEPFELRNGEVAAPAKIVLDGEPHPVCTALFAREHAYTFIYVCMTRATVHHRYFSKRGRRRIRLCCGAS